MSVLHRRHEEELEFQIAPMVDVLLVMLIFFVMITSASVLRVDAKIKLPIARHAGKMNKSWNEGMINVHWEADTRYSYATMMAADGQILRFDKMDDLTKHLKGLIAGDGFRAILRSDREVPASAIQKVMGACAAAGIGDIVFSAVNLDR
jgi:biopolymer transport protein ExbD